MWKIKLRLEDHGVLDTRFERDVSSSLKKINSKLSILISGINELILSLESGLSSINETLSTQIATLTNIDEGIGFNNLMTTINAYQLFKANKNTISLRKWMIGIQ